ncbi:MAG: hypothetical protein JSW46_07575 [Gemmatimonadota bacterium]|nr:MAG: hypothetical protein JSW46_07575 [Gemmatimonadota bacterium]
MTNKVLGPGYDEARIKTNRPLDLRGHKYTLITLSGKGIDYADPDLILDG